MSDQFRKSLRGSCAYLLVSNMSATLNFPTVMTSRLAVWIPANWLMPASTFWVSPPRSMVCRMNARVQPQIGIVGADLVGFPAGKAGDAERAAETETLVDLRIDP